MVLVFLTSTFFFIQITITRHNKTIQLTNVWWVTFVLVIHNRILMAYVACALRL